MDAQQQLFGLMAVAEREKRDPLPGAPLPKNVVQLPLWPEPVRAVPNGFLRSALFGAIAKGKRRYIDGEQLAALDGIAARPRSRSDRACPTASVPSASR